MAWTCPWEPVKGSVFSSAHLEPVETFPLVCFDPGQGDRTSDASGTSPVTWRGWESGLNVCAHVCITVVSTGFGVQRSSLPRLVSVRRRTLGIAPCQEVSSGGKAPGFAVPSACSQGQTSFLSHRPPDHMPRGAHPSASCIQRRDGAVPAVGAAPGWRLGPVSLPGPVTAHVCIHVHRCSCVGHVPVKGRGDCNCEPGMDGGVVSVPACVINWLHDRLRDLKPSPAVKTIWLLSQRQKEIV